MGILDSIVEWIATQIMNLLDLVTGSVLGALGCDMSTFLRYFPAAETLYEVFVAIAVGFILLNLVWQLFKNFGLGVGLSAEDPTKLAIKSILFIFLALFADQIMVLVLGIAGTPYGWVVDTALSVMGLMSRILTRSWITSLTLSKRMVETSASPGAFFCFSIMALKPPIVSDSSPLMEPLRSRIKTISVRFLFIANTSNKLWLFGVSPYSHILL